MSHAQRPLIAPSLLAADFSQLGAEVRALDAAGADWLHFDVMDGHFVPNLTFGAGVVKALRPYSALPFDVHVMVSPVDLWVADFAAAGATSLTFHPEAGAHVHRTLQHIKAHGMKVGLALNPATMPEVMAPLLPELDLVLVMSVNPGFGGQKFIPSALDKVRAVRRLIDEAGCNILLEVDGGVTPDNAAALVAAGADVLVAGSAIMKGNQADYARHITQLRGDAGV